MQFGVERVIDKNVTITCNGVTHMTLRHAASLSHVLIESLHVNEYIQREIEFSIIMQLYAFSRSGCIEMIFSYTNVTITIYYY